MLEKLLEHFNHGLANWGVLFISILVIVALLALGGMVCLMIIAIVRRAPVRVDKRGRIRSLHGLKMKRIEKYFK